jgi:hypothetical protein
MPTTFTILPEIQSLIPRLTPEEYDQLQANLLEYGCRDPLVVWQERQVLLDGHNRAQICDTNDVQYLTTEVSLPDLDAAKEWVIANQLGRRNLSPEQMRYYRGEQYNLQKRQGARTDLTSDHDDLKSQNTAARLAKEHKVSEPTIKRDGAYATAVETLATLLGPEVRQAILAGDYPLVPQDVKVLAAVASRGEDAVQALKDVLQEDDPGSHLQGIARGRQCRICEKQLTDPVSVSRGMGPICARFRTGPSPTSTGGSTGRAAPALFTEMEEPAPDDAPAVEPNGAGLTERERALFGSRDQKPVGSVEWCWQTIYLLKRRAEQKDITDQQWREIFDEAWEHHIWTVVPSEQPYGSYDALARAELWDNGPRAGWDSLIAEAYGMLGLLVTECELHPTLLETEVPDCTKLRDICTRFLALWAPQAPPAPAPETPAPAPEAAGTIGKRIVEVLRAAPAGMENAAIGAAIGKDRKRSFQALQSLIEKGIVRKEGLVYQLVTQKES